MKQRLFIPGPVAVSERVLAAMALPMINHRGPEFADLQRRIERRLKPIYGTGGDVVLLPGSGTSGLEASVASLFSPGDRVLACPVGVFGKRLAAIARTYGIETDVLETRSGSALDPNALRERLAGAHYDGILLTQNETSTGVQNDMAALAEAVAGSGATVVVDAVSGLAASEFRMDDWGFDAVVSASQKALAVPPGLAMVAVSARGWERAETSRAPSFYLDLRKARDFARDGQTPWTPPVSVMFALDVALELYEAAGPAAAWERHARYARAIRAAVAALGLQTLSQPGAHSPTVVAILVPDGVDGPAVARTLREEHGIVVGGGQAELKGKIWRIGTMGDLSEGDILGALSSFEAALHAHGYAAPAGEAARAAAAVLEVSAEGVAAP